MDDAFVDAWLFVSMASAGGRGDASLTDLMWAADYINRTVPSEAELEAGLNRLIQSGLLEPRGRRFRVTRAGRRRYRELRARSLFEMVEQFAASYEVPAEYEFTWTPEPGEVRRAQEAYEKAFWETARKHGIGRTPDGASTRAERVAEVRDDAPSE